MMCLPAGLGIIRPASGGVSGTISFFASSESSYIDSGTSITSPSTPFGIENGDGIYAFVFARSALTPPAGWTLVDSQVNVGSVTQTLYVYKKDTVTTGDASTSFNWQQDSSGRMGLAYVVVRSSTGIIVDAETDSAETDAPSGTSWDATVPILTATEDGEMFLLAATAELASASANTWTPPSGSTLRAGNNQPNNRLAAATQSRNSGQSNSSPYAFDASSTAALNYFSTITIRLQAG